MVSGRSNVLSLAGEDETGIQRLPQPAEAWCSRARAASRPARAGYTGCRRASPPSAEDGVFEAVAGQDDDGTVRREVAIEQRLRNRPGALQRLPVAEALPRAVLTAAREERAVRRVLRPMFEALGDAPGMTAERDGTSSVDGAVIARVETVGRETMSGMAGRRRVPRPVLRFASTMTVAGRAHLHLDRLDWRAEPPGPPPALSRRPARREAFLKTIARPRVPLDATARQRQEPGDAIVEEISFAAEAGERVPGLLFKPRGAARRRPVVIVLHGTGGSKEGMAGRLRELAAKGFVAVAIDGRHHGARIGPVRTACPRISRRSCAPIVPAGNIPSCSTRSGT